MNTAMVIARNTISEALRKKILNAFLMVGVVLIALTFIFQQFAPRQELTLVKGMGLGIISLAGLFITVILCINLVPTEVERRTIYTILAKPVRRYEFLLGKFFGALGTLGINIGLMGLAFVVAVAVKQIGAENAVSPLILFKGILMIAMQMLLLAALAMFFSTFLTPLVNFFLTMVLFVIGVWPSVTSRSEKVTEPVATLASASSSVTAPFWASLVISTTSLEPVMVTVTVCSEVSPLLSFTVMVKFSVRVSPTPSA